MYSVSFYNPDPNYFCYVARKFIFSKTKNWFQIWCIHIAWCGNVENFKLYIYDECAFIIRAYIAEETQI